MNAAVGLTAGLGLDGDRCIRVITRQNLYKVTLGLTTGATYNMTNVHVFKAAQARRAYFFLPYRAISLMRIFLEEKIKIMRDYCLCFSVPRPMSNIQGASRNRGAVGGGLTSKSMSFAVYRRIRVQMCNNPCCE